MLRRFPKAWETQPKEPETGEGMDLETMAETYMRCLLTVTLAITQSYAAKKPAIPLKAFLTIMDSMLKQSCQLFEFCFKAVMRPCLLELTALRTQVAEL